MAPLVPPRISEGSRHRGELTDLAGEIAAHAARFTACRAGLRDVPRRFGELPRGELPQLLDTSDRHARRVVAALAVHGAIVSDSTRTPLRLAFPATLAARWMPGLFPEQR